MCVHMYVHVSVCVCLCAHVCVVHARICFLCVEEIFLDQLPDPAFMRSLSIALPLFQSGLQLSGTIHQNKPFLPQVAFGCGTLS